VKVLHCPTETGGHAWGLSRAERKLGIHSDVMVRRSSWLQFPCDVDLRLRQGSWAAQALRLITFWGSAVRSYDVFHFNWGMSLLDHRQWHLHYWDFPILKRLGKRIIVTFQGCDARMKSFSRGQFSTSACAECDVAWCTDRMDRIRQARIRKVAVYADKVFAVNPDLLHVLPGAEFLPYAHVDPSDWACRSQAEAVGSATAPVRVLHMPTNRSIKGTKYVEQACARLRQEGVPVELLLAERLPHDRAISLLQQADLVVDQLLVGWYGGTAVEAMAAGKPVLCYIREEDARRFVSFHDRIPIVRTTKETLAEDLRSLIASPARRREIGDAGRRFVSDCHDPMKIARTTVAAYHDACAV